MRRHRLLNRQNIIFVFTLIIIGYLGHRFFFSNLPFLHDVYTPVGVTINFIQTQISKSLDYVTTLGKVVKENEELKNELKQNQVLLQNYEELTAENIRLKRFLKVKDIKPFTRKIGTIIGTSPDIWHKEVLINLGKKDNLEVDNSVISSWGLIGRVKTVSEISSTIQLITDNSNWVSCQNNRSRAIGLLKSENNKQGKLYFLVNKSDFRQNDLVVTSGLGGIYPKGIPVGMVSKVIKKSGDDIPEIEIDYLSDFDDLEEVIVLVNNEK